MAALLHVSKQLNARSSILSPSPPPWIISRAKKSEWGYKKLIKWQSRFESRNGGMILTPDVESRAPSQKINRFALITIPVAAAAASEEDDRQTKTPI